MKLYELEWGLYPRRIGIYLAEKGIVGVERIAFDALSGWPPAELATLSPHGTLPILQIEDGTMIRTSIAILEYLEERFPTPDLLGQSPDARARTRELCSVIEETAFQFGVWCHNGSALFAGREMQSKATASIAADAYIGRLRLLDRLIAETPGPFLGGSTVTIADCAAMATLQFAKCLYGVQIPSDCLRLASWYANFEIRSSATPPFYPGPILKLAYGLPDTLRSKG